MAHATVLLLCAVMNALSDEALHSADRCSHAAALANSPCCTELQPRLLSRLRVSLQALRCGHGRNPFVLGNATAERARAGTECQQKS